MSDQGGVYSFYALLVDKYIKARNRDILPDVGTEKCLGMKGEPAGRNLYGAFKTLYLHGRFSRTMMEQALGYSPTSYPEYIQLYLRSLPPDERSMYAADLYNSNFAGIQWDMKLYGNCFANRGTASPPIQPPEPLGDNRHEPKQASAIQHAAEFHALLKCQFLFESMDINAPLDAEYQENMGFDYDLLDGVKGKLFGIVKSELTFGERSDNGRVLTSSEIMVRAWNILYFAERLSKTELECALVAGPDAMKNFFRTAIHLTQSYFAKPENEQILASAANIIAGDKVEFAELPVEGTTVVQECDYCGEEIATVRKCANCKIAMFCNRECQTGDWKRHKFLCKRYQAHASDA